MIWRDPICMETASVYIYKKDFFFLTGWNMAGAIAPQTARWACPRKFVISWAFPTFLH